MIFKSLKIWIIGSVIVLVMVLIYSVGNKNNANKQYLLDKCRWSSNMSSKTIIGVVEQKYFDKRNHNKPTLLLLEKNRQSKVHFANELSGFYNFIEIGDSLFKNSNSLQVDITRNSNILKRKLNYGCKAVDN